MAQRHRLSRRRGYSDLYYLLSNAVAEDEELAAFIAPMPIVQPNLFVAAVQFLTGPEEMPASREELTAMVRERKEEIAALMHSRRTQTNEPGRCATLLPSLQSGPLALLEVGASGGLCLLLDEFYYDYGDVHLGPDESPVRLRCTVQGRPPIPTALPEVVWRSGLDLMPVDLRDDDDVRWLLSCVWAEHRERRERLAAAVELAKQREAPVRFEIGSAHTDR